jgi:hypothetical protein
MWAGRFVSVDYAERQKHYAKIEKDRKTKVLTFVWAKTKRERGPEPAPFLVTAPAAGDGSPAAAGYASGEIGAGATYRALAGCDATRAAAELFRI